MADQPKSNTRYTTGNAGRRRNNNRNQKRITNQQLNRFRQDVINASQARGKIVYGEKDINLTQALDTIEQANNVRLQGHFDEIKHQLESGNKNLENRILRKIGAQAVKQKVTQVYPNTQFRGPLLDRDYDSSGTKIRDEAYVMAGMLADGPLSNIARSALGLVSPIIKPWLEKAGGQLYTRAKQVVLPWIAQQAVNAVNSDDVQRLYQTVQQYASQNLHDLHPVFQMAGNYVPEIGSQDVVQGFSDVVENAKVVQPNSMTQLMEGGVAIESIQASLNPERHSSTVCTVETPMALLSKTLNYPIIVNAAGDGLLSIHPANIAGDIFITKCFRDDFDPSTGSTEHPVYVGGNYNDATSKSMLTHFQLVGFQVRILITLPQLLLQGSLIASMNPEGFTTHEYNGDTDKVGTNELLAAPYCVQTSISEANKMQFALEPLQQGDSFIKGSESSPFGSRTSGAFDQMIIQVQGAPKSSTGTPTEIGKIQVIPVIQYIPSPERSQFLDMRLPPVGPMTILCLRTLIQFNKNILLLGRAEMNAFTDGLSTLTPTHNSVMQYAANFFSKGAIQDKLVINVGTNTYGGARSGPSSKAVLKSMLPPHDKVSSTNQTMAKQDVDDLVDETIQKLHITETPHGQGQQNEKREEAQSEDSYQFDPETKNINPDNNTRVVRHQQSQSSRQTRASTPFQNDSSKGKKH